MSTIAECAKHLKMNERNFKVLLDSGVIKRATRNNYSLDVVRETYIEHLRTGRGEDGSADLTKARTRHATARAESAELENAIARGDYVKTSDAVQWMVADALVVKEKLLSLSGELSGPLDAEQCELVDNKIREALHELSDIKSFMKLIKKYNAEDLAAKELKKIEDDDKGDDANA